MSTTIQDFLEFVYTNAFVASAKGVLSTDELRELEQELIAEPEQGTVERGTGGVRKMRFALEGRGKSGGARVVYFYLKRRGRIYLLFAYPKNEKSALTQAERNELRKLSKQLEE